MKKLLPAIVALVIALCATDAAAQAPQGYYKSLEGKREAELKTAVYNLIHNFTKVSSYQNLPQYFQRTDVYPESDRWWDMYSDIPLYAPSFKGLNREHSFPKSWWGGSEKTPAYTDLNHLYPSEARANQAKSNYPLGEVDRNETVKFQNGISTVGYPVRGQGGGSVNVFEPDDEYKGDFARTYFYMATCYQQGLTWKYTYMVNQTEYPTLNGWAVEMLLKWHREDPVSQKEINRNNVIYSIQNNRNPFIDRPELAEYIWGNRKGEPYTPSQSDTPTGDPDLVSPAKGMSLDFGQVAIGSKIQSQIFFKGQNLTGTLTLQIYAGDITMFALETKSLSAALVNAEEGTWVNVTYSPTEIGSHTARLLVSDGGFAGGSRAIELRGECLDLPKLTACTATEATDITSDSYTANWTYPENEVIDYWVITREKYAGGTVTTEEIVAEAPGYTIDGFGASDREAYSVQSVRLGYRSPASNVIFVEHSGITGVTADQGLEVQGFDGMIRFLCTAPQTGACIYDVTGSLILCIDEIRSNMTVDLPTGIYFVVTDQCHTPVKVAVM